MRISKSRDNEEQQLYTPENSLWARPPMALDNMNELNDAAVQTLRWRLVYSEEDT